MIKREITAGENAAIFRLLTKETRDIGAGRNRRALNAPVELAERLAKRVDQPVVQASIAQHSVEHAVGGQTAHLDQPVDDGAFTAQ